MRYYALAVNEFNYKKVSFTTHHSLERAEASAYRPYKGSPLSDYSPVIIEGKDEFIAWATECNYKIDWDKKLLMHKELK